METEERTNPAGVCAGKVIVFRYRPWYTFKLGLRIYPTAIALSIFLLISGFVLLGFFGFHAWGASIGVTKHDRLKQARANKARLEEVWNGVHALPAAFPRAYFTMLVGWPAERFPSSFPLASSGLSIQWCRDGQGHQHILYTSTIHLPK